MVPHVADADEARRVVDMVRCHPLGRKPLDWGNIDGRFCQIPLTEYAIRCNTERLVILQIESPEAVENVDAIAAVPGFDALLFGAGDFSHRIGKLGNITDPEVVAARKRVATAAKKHGKHVMAASLYGQKDMLIEESTGIFTLGADVLTLGAGLGRLVADFDGSEQGFGPGTSVYSPEQGASRSTIRLCLRKSGRPRLSPGRISRLTVRKSWNCSGGL